jgi:hypothetical protein
MEWFNSKYQLEINQFLYYIRSIEVIRSYGIEFNTHTQHISNIGLSRMI